MANRSACGRAVVVLVLPALLAACASAPGPSPSPSPTSTPTMMTPTPSVDPQLQNAKQAVVQLWAVVDRLTNDPKASLQDLDAVASGDALDFFRKNLTSYRLENLTGSGSSAVEFQSAEASGSNSQGLPTWTVSACVDSSKTKLVDTSGKDVTTPPYRFQHRSVVVEQNTTMRVDQDEVLGTC